MNGILLVIILSLAGLALLKLVIDQIIDVLKVRRLRKELAKCTIILSEEEKQQLRELASKKDV